MTNFFKAQAADQGYLPIPRDAMPLRQTASPTSAASKFRPPPNQDIPLDCNGGDITSETESDITDDSSLNETPFCRQRGKASNSSATRTPKHPLTRQSPQLVVALLALMFLVNQAFMYILLAVNIKMQYATLQVVTEVFKLQRKAPDVVVPPPFSLMCQPSGISQSYGSKDSLGSMGGVWSVDLVWHFSRLKKSVRKRCSVNAAVGAYFGPASSWFLRHRHFPLPASQPASQHLPHGMSVNASAEELYLILPLSIKGFAFNNTFFAHRAQLNYGDKPNLTTHTLLGLKSISQESQRSQNLGPQKLGIYHVYTFPQWIRSKILPFFMS
ncbi:hypothetical protein B0H17DRAFT_1141806 [Mycena rosella]|uniref:Uncharacterized protein n=1 Tax=Mycena rosella TaxID=1033263 RepID=A0AAD7G5V1_MYCRO|nr:hypothetical protein B0H17DRAFT_1141806 [Mycena rosella]